MKRALLFLMPLWTISAFGADASSVITHDTCTLITDLFRKEELAEQGYTPAIWYILGWDKKLHPLEITDPSSLVETGVGKGPEREEEARKLLELRLGSLQVAKFPRLVVYDENGKRLDLKSESLNTHMFSMDLPRLPKDRNKKIYFEYVASVDRAVVVKREKYWISLEPVPVHESVVFKSKVFTLSEVARELLKNHPTEDNQDIVAIANNKPFSDEDSFGARLSEMALLYYVLEQAKGQDFDLSAEMKKHIPICQKTLLPKEVDGSATDSRGSPKVSTLTESKRIQAEALSQPESAASSSSGVAK